MTETWVVGVTPNGVICGLLVGRKANSVKVREISRGHLGRAESIWPGHNIVARFSSRETAEARMAAAHTARIPYDKLTADMRRAATDMANEAFDAWLAELVKT